MIQCRKGKHALAAKLRLRSKKTEGMGFRSEEKDQGKKASDFRAPERS